METYKLGTLCRIASSKRIFESEYVDEGIPFVRGLEITDGRLFEPNAKFDCYISKERYEELKAKYGIPVAGDILITAVGTIGNLAYLPRNIEFYFKDGNLIWFSNFAEKVDSKYLYFFMKSPFFYKQINYSLIGAVQKALTMDLLSKIEIPLPDLPTQKKIADVLSCIDDKIALNNKTNTELENMAKTIYDYWFTQFDFPDKNGHPYKTSGGQMVYNEILKREIPAGWEVKNILDCCKVIDCLHSKKPDYCYEDENCYLLQLENLIDLKLIDLTNKYYVSKKDYEIWTSKTKVKQGDLVVTNAGRVGGVSRIPSYIETGIGRNMTSIRPINISEYLLCYFFSSSDCDKQIRQNTDQGAFFQSLNVKGIKKLNLTIPPKEIQEKFDSLVGKIRLQIESNHKENEELTKLRDYLLPLLMNGQIEVI